MLKVILSKWNILDCFFFELDKLLKIVKEMQAEPDVESMVEAETRYLKTENESLKSLQYPKQVTKVEENYSCPNKKCKTKIPRELIIDFKIKYCPKCGQRIYYIETYNPNHCL